MSAPRPRPEPTADQGPPSHAAWARLRWHDLVDSLVAEGLAPDDARRAVAQGLEAIRPGWRRLVARQDPDVEAWQEVRAAAGLPARPGEVAPMVGAPRDVPPDPLDRPDPWLDEARTSDRGRSLRVLAVLGVAVAVLAVVSTWWVGRPEAPEVREGDNVLPVPWYDGAELHLADWTVDLAAVEAFAADDDGAVVARVAGGETWRIESNGSVSGPDAGEVPAADPPAVPDAIVLTTYDRVTQSVAGPDGVTVHVLDSRAQVDSGGFTRLSESGRRTVVVCDADEQCSTPLMPDGAGEVRLR